VGRRHVGLSQGTRPWGILGGTFDPLHLGHLAIAEHTREALDLAGVVFVPAAQSPFKPDTPTTPIEHVVISCQENRSFDH